MDLPGTPQERLLAVGAVTALVSKFYFKKGWGLSATFGLAAISVYSIITAKPDTAA